MSTLKLIETKATSTLETVVVVEGDHAELQKHSQVNKFALDEARKQGIDASGSSDPYVRPYPVDKDGHIIEDVLSDHAKIATWRARVRVMSRI